MPDKLWHPYTAWEDWQAGMWSPSMNAIAEVQEAARILGDPPVFLSAAQLMLQDWPRAAEQNLTGSRASGRSWVGQATCMHLAGIREESTRRAWWTLTPLEQADANRTADSAIDSWRGARARA